MLSQNKKPEPEFGSNCESSETDQSFNEGPEDLWGSLLSRQPPIIRSAFISLDLSARRMVINHLQLMATQPGWQPQQIQSAKFALEVLGY